MNTKSRVVELFQQRFGRTCTGVAHAPGRVNLLGEHVDYNAGWVLPVAIDRETYVAFAPTESDECDILAADFSDGSRFSLRKIFKGKDEAASLAEWVRYPAGVAWSLNEKGLELKPIQAVIASDVPRGAGLSSSASVELAFASAWQAMGGWHLPRMEMALACQRAENQYVGVNCGIMDQAASACGEAGRLLVLDCRSLTYETLPLPAGVAVVIADTGVRHSLTTSAYNARRAACEQAVQILKRDLPGITSLRDVSPADFDRLANKLPSQVAQRARHVVEEIGRTRLAIDLLRRGDLQSFGRLMNACHASLRDLYEVSCPELDAMVEIAQSLAGCYGARLTGAGFGGCTVNLVDLAKVEVFTRQLGERYSASTNLHAEIYVCTAAAGAGLV